MSMSDHIKQRVLQEFFATYRKYFTYLESRQRGTLF